MARSEREMEQAQKTSERHAKIMEKAEKRIANRTPQRATAQAKAEAKLRRAVAKAAKVEPNATVVINLRPSRRGIKGKTVTLKAVKFVQKDETDNPGA